MILSIVKHRLHVCQGMVHDGERGEANTCDPSSHLMSPVLGPGKVTWSPCSDQELASFLTGPDTKIQVEIMFSNYCIS